MKNWLIAFLVSVPALSQAQQVLPLDEAIKIALENNYDVVTASQSTEVARLQNHPGNAGMLPTVTLNGNASYSLSALRQDFSSGLSVNTTGVNGRQFGAGAVLDWVVFDGLRMFAIKKRLKSQYDLAALNEQDQMIKTVSQVIQTYTLFASETSRLRGLQTTAAYFGELAQLAESRLKIGTGNKQEVLQAKTDWNAQRSAILKQLAYLQQLRIQINILLNREPGTDFLPDSNIAVNRNLALEESLGNAASSNPSVLIAEKNAAIFKASLKEQISYQMPTIRVGLGYNYSYSGNSAGFALFSQSHGPQASAGLTFPIFNGWRVRRNISTAKVQYENAKFATDFTKLRIAGEVRMAYETYRRQLEILALEEDNITMAEENMTIAAERYKSGVGTLIESRAAALSYADAQTRYTQAQSDTKAAEVNLLALTGQLIK